MITRTYKTVGTLALQADVYGTENPAVNPRPAIVWIHGGALIMGNRAGIVPEQLDRYVNAGFVVVCIDYRLAPETKLPAIAEDIEDAFRWVRESGRDEFGIDAGRIGVVGHSAGGYLTLLAGHRVDPPPQALVSFYGYGNIAGDWYSKPDPFYNTFDRLTEDEAQRAIGETELVDGAADPARRDYYLWCRQNGLWPLKVGDHDPISETDWFVPYSPAENVSETYPPTLLLHGNADTDVPYEQSVHMASRLVAAGVEHEMITIAGGPHGFDRDPAPELVDVVSNAFDRALAFLTEHV